MKSKLIRVIIIILLATLSIVAKAQMNYQSSISIGTETNTRLNQNSYYNYSNDIHIHGGLGVNLRFEAPINKALHFTASVGYIYFESDVVYLTAPVRSESNYYDPSFNGLSTSPYTYVPVNAGLKYYLAKYFYVAAQAGSAFATTVKAQTSFIYSGWFGAVVPIGPHHGLDFGVKLERGYKNIDYTYPLNQLGLNVAYKYRF